MNDTSYKKYLLTILVIVLAFNSVDRMALGLVMQDIKRDLQLTDTQLGLVTGFAFAVFYSVMGIPIARWADRGNRITIIAVTTAAWSAMVALCGAATSFMQLLLMRIGVAVGEAGAVPPAHSLIADHFTRNERPRAMGVYMLGIPLSTFIGYFGAGWINELVGWRMMFLILAMPGLLVAALAWFTLKEPRRAAAVAATAAPPAAAAAPDLKEVLVTLWKLRTFRHLLLTFSAAFFFNYGISQWLPAFFIRSHGMSIGSVGTWFALVFGVAGFIGIYWGGAIASRYFPSNERLQLKIATGLFFTLLIFRPLAFMAPSFGWAFALLVPASMVLYLSEGSLFAMTQTLVPARMRAMAIALVYLFANLIGMGLGPLAVGVLSDLFQPWAGDQSLRYALVALCPAQIWIIWHLWRASKSVTHDLETVRANQAREHQQVEDWSTGKEMKTNQLPLSCAHPK